MLVRKLTPRERRFCRAMLATGDPLKAAEAAGYANHGAGRALIKRPAVKAELARLEQRMEETRDADAIASAQEVQAKLTQLMWHGAEKTQLGAAQTLAKIHGLLRDRVEHSGPDGGPIEVVPMSRREIVERLAALSREDPNVRQLVVDTIGVDVTEEAS